MNHKFLIGGSIAPLGMYTHLPVSEWENTMRQMHELGLNSYRSFVCWNRVERKEGVYDYSEIDASLELAEKYKLSALLNVGGMFNNMQGFRPPAWMYHKYRRTHRIDNPTMSSSYPSPDIYLCSDDPFLREKSLLFVEKTVRRYASHPALEGWSVWNEPHGDPCYCEHSIRAFRVWLQKRYSSLDELNEHWGTVFPVDFPSWDHVRPAFCESPYGHIAPCQKLDWARFCEENFLEKFNTMEACIRKLDPVHDTTFNLQGVHGHDASRFHVKTSGISAYFESLPEGPRVQYVWCNLYMKAARTDRRTDEKVRIIETDSGPRPAGKRPGCQRHAAVCDWSLVAMGAKNILAWIYRTRIDGGHALQSQLTDWNGNVTDRLKEFAARARIFRSNEERILAAHPFPASIGVWYDMSLYRIHQVEKPHVAANAAERCHDGFLMLAQDAGFSVEFITDAMLERSGESRPLPSVLLVPSRPHLTDAQADALRRHVERGGLLVAEALFGVKDEFMTVRRGPLPYKLSDVFGLECTDMEYYIPDKDAIVFPGGARAEGEFCKCTLSLAPKTEVRAEFTDGTPAATFRRYGKGAAVFVASTVSVNCGADSDALRTFLTDLAAETTDARPMYTPVPGDVGIYPATKDNVTADMLYVVNYADAERKIRLAPAESIRGSGDWTDLIGGKTYRLPDDVTLSPLQVLALAKKDCPETEI